MGEKTRSLKDASTNCTISVPRFFSTILILTAWWNRWNALFQKRILPPTNPSPWDNTSKIPLIKPLSIGTTRSQQTDSSVLAVDEFIEKSKWVGRIFWGFSRKFGSVEGSTPLPSTIYFFQHEPPWSWLNISFLILHPVNPSSTGIWTWWADIRGILISPISLIFNDGRLDPFEFKRRRFCKS